MALDFAVVTISHAIQQAVAPVFLLAGIGAMLNVLTNRLARIIDRSRALHARLETVNDILAGPAHEELSVLYSRARVVHRAIAFSTTSALLVCVVIAVLFLSALVGLSAGALVALLFVLAMMCLIIALSGFLREIQLATRVMLNGP
ncbi:MAG: DUF2721 domain-containing protein [Spongiibacteraceae bacterium]